MLEETGVPAVARAVILTVSLVVAVFMLWASFTRVDETAVAQGKVIPSGRIKKVQSEDGGVVEALLVRDGDKVERGQVLARLERTRAETAWLETRARAAALTATVAR